MSISMIYVDMDGVIADFSKRYKEKFKVTPEQTRNNKEFGGYFEKFIDDREFQTLDMMLDTFMLLGFLNDLTNSIVNCTTRQSRTDCTTKTKVARLSSH